MAETRAQLIRASALVGLVGAAFGPFALLVTDEPTLDLAQFTILVVVIAVSFGVVTWFGAGSQPDNRVIWILALFVLSLAPIGLGQFIAANVSPELTLPLDNETTVPATLDPVVAWTEGVANAIATIGFTSLMTLGILLFPDGSLPGRRWRPVAYVFVLMIAFSAFMNVVMWAPSNTVAPFGEGGPGHVSAAGAAAGLFQLVGPLVALGGLIGKFRRGNATERNRIKWIIWGAAVLIPLASIGSTTGLTYITVIGVLTFVASFGIAILRHRLYDIDVVISRSLVFGALAVFIGLVYIAVVVGVGTLLGTADEPNAALAIAATTFVAVSFQPLRYRFERVANRFVYGRRSTPYEVLSEFSQRAAATDEALLVDAARGLVDGTTAERAVVAVAMAGQMVPAAAWPEDNGKVLEESQSFAIQHDGLELGELTLSLPRGQSLSEADVRLASEMASALGLALRKQALTESLQARVRELRLSQQRLVAIQDDTRRKLERDLHDGAQQQLVALKVKLGLARQLAEKEGAARTADMLDQLSGDTDAAVDTVRDFARGVYPPLLEAEGLASAIRSQARRAPITVDVEDAGLSRYPRQVESTVYFCVLEALQNATKYANASRATVTLTADEDGIGFTVTDDGDGFDLSAVTLGAGLVNMQDRLGAIDGKLTIGSTPGAGTTVTGAIPADALADADAGSTS